MDHKNKLKDLHKESLEKIEQYVASNTLLEPSEQKKIHDAKTQWQLAWVNLEEALLVLEKIEI
jgi:hypothetical protein